MTEWMPAGGGCTCLVNPNPYTHYGIVEPGDALAPDPLCPQHFPPRWKLACINWGTNLWGAPKALVYCLVGGEATCERYFALWADAVSWLDEHGDSLDHWARFLAEKAASARDEWERSRA
jgi:hypothetical protein